LGSNLIYGAKRIRTADPLNAIEVLYQLSYNPVKRVFNSTVFVGSLSSLSDISTSNCLEQAELLSHLSEIANVTAHQKIND
jgi:hypothetical protein